MVWVVLKREGKEGGGRRGMGREGEMGREGGEEL